MAASDSRIQIIVACLGLAGVIATAVIANLDKFSGHTDSKPAAISTGAAPAPTPAAITQDTGDAGKSPKIDVPAAVPSPGPLKQDVGGAAANPTPVGYLPPDPATAAPASDRSNATKVARKSAGGAVAVPDSTFYSLPDNVMLTTASPYPGTPLNLNTAVVFNVTLHYRLTSLKQATLNLQVDEHTNDTTCTNMGFVKGSVSVPIVAGEHDVTVSVPYLVHFQGGSVHYGVVLYSDYQANQVLKIFSRLPQSCYPFSPS